MLFSKVLLAAAASCIFEVAIAQDDNNQDGGNGGNQDGGNGGNQNGGNGGASPTLNADALQTASASDGQGNGVQGVKAGQAPALTDDANFINFCSGKTLTNGLQNKQGSCNGIPMGDIPGTGNMVASIITNPAPGDDLTPNQDFDVEFTVANLNAGFFTNPDVTYYSSPQQLDNGNIVGHVHVTIQTLGDSLTPQEAPDASTFVFFKGVDDNGDGNGHLKATVTGGLPAGSYRVCLMTAAMNHQPVLMPVAQRGAQDDCTKYTVGAGNGGNGGNANGGNANGGNGDNGNANGGNANGGNANGGNANGGNANGGNANGGNANGGAVATTTGDAAASATTTAAAQDQQFGGQQGGQQNGGQQNGGQQTGGDQTVATTTQAFDNGQQAGATTQAAAAATTTAAQNFDQGGQQQGGQGATTTGGFNAGAFAGNGGGFGGNGQFGGQFRGRRRQYQGWRNRFQSRPYVV